MAHLLSVASYYDHHEASLDALVRGEVARFVDDFGKLPEVFQIRASSRAESEGVAQYWRNLRDSWDAHNKLALEIDSFLEKGVDWQLLAIVDECVQEAQNYLKKAFWVEDEKRIYSAGVKHAVNFHADRLAQTGRITSSDLALVLTIWDSDFWSYRYGEHVQWLLGKNAKEQDLVRTFHAGSRRLLQERIDTIVPVDIQRSQTELRLASQEYKELCQRAADRRRIGEKLVERRPDLRALNSLIEYDSRTEVLFGYGLYGVPDLLLRLAVINFLVANSYIDRRPSIMHYSVEDLCGATYKIRI